MQPTSAPPRLIGEAFSPWTKKARWALEQCGLAYDYEEYVPTLCEPKLRWRLRQWSGSVSVPVLFVGQQVLRGSWEIARYANDAASKRTSETASNTASDKPLGDFEAIAGWNELSETALAEGRTRVVRCVLDDKQALQEGLPTFVPKPLRNALTFVARDAVKRLDRKYAHLVKPNAIRHALEAIRKRLDEVNGDYLLGNFSYADITMAVVLEVIAPIANVEPPLGPATQQCWHDAALANEFKDLLAWRDRLAADHTTSYSQFNIE